jgi:tetratricopeptide (TPR) repeat protein
MQLITARCPDCGADLKIPEGSVSVVCDYCGSNVIVSDILGPNAVVQNCMILAYAALQGENYKDAYDHFNKALELNGTNYNAWFGKAICAGMMSHFNDVRFDEMLVLFDNAIRNAPADKQENLKKNAAAEINKAVMKFVNGMTSGREIFLSASQGGGISLNLGNIRGDIMKMKDEVIRAMEKAHEYDPSNKDVSNNLDNIKNNRLPGQEQNPFMQRLSASDIPGAGKKKGSSALGCFALILLLGIGVAYYLVNQANKDRTLSNMNNKSTTTQSPTSSVPQYSIAYMTEKKGTACVSVVTDAVNDNDMLNINNEVIEKYYTKYKIIYVNYFSDKNSAVKYSNLQNKYSLNWITSNSSNIGLKATMEYNANNESSRFYKYIDGKTADIGPMHLPPSPPND